MGLCLYALDGDATGPDACWSYGSFAEFRRRLAEAEGFVLGDMWGFGGDRQWEEISTSLEPFLNHPDDHSKDIAPEDCAAILPRLENILEQWVSMADSEEDLADRHIEDARNLVTVLRICVSKGVVLAFG